MSKKSNIQEERHKLMNEIFDLYDVEHTGYVDIKDSLKMLAAMGKNLEPEDENDFLIVADPNKEGVISKQNFLKGVEILFTIPDSYLPEIKDAFEFFDKKNNGKITCKDFKKILVKQTNEYTEKDAEELFKTLDLNSDGEININDFINLWKFQ